MQEKYRKNDLMYKCTNIQRAYLLGRESHFELGGGVLRTSIMSLLIN